MIAKIKELRKNEEGFTLIELMVVVLIIGVLAAIAIPVFLNLQKEGIKASVKSDVKNTVTNVATFLASSQANSQANLAAMNNATTGVKKVATDGNTITIGGTGWQSYTVTGSNTNVTAPTAGQLWSYVFTSTTGAYTEGTVAAPVIP